MSGASEAASRRGGVTTPCSRLEGLDLRPWLGLQRGGRRRRGQSQATPGRLRPKSKSRERLAEMDEGSPETAKGRDTISKRETQEGRR